MATSRTIIGSIINYHRKQKPMTLQALGDKIGKDRQYMWKVENGKINISVDALDVLIKTLGCNHNDFFNQTKIKNSK
jgi:transcriptional regulator with XRE-family HTH domain